MTESLRTYLTAVARHPDTWRLVLMPPEGAPEVLRRAIANGRAAVLERLVRAVRPGLRPGNRDPTRSSPRGRCRRSPTSTRG